MNCVILCIGTDKISGDCLGPMVGTMLRHVYHLPHPVLGVEGCCVNGINLDAYRQLIRRYYPSTTIIAVDAAVGAPQEIGHIKVRMGGVQAGGALGRSGSSIGDIGILGVVGSREGDTLSTLMQAPFDQVEALARRIAYKLYCALTA